MPNSEGQKTSIHLALYSSPHGLGHFMRIINLARLLHQNPPSQRSYHLFVRSNVPPSILRSLRDGWKDFDTAITFSTPKFPIQPSIIQTNPYTLSATETWDAVRNFDDKAALAQEEEFVKENDIQILISDCPSIPCILPIPSILVTNFTFDTILSALAENDAGADDQIHTFIRTMTGQYNKASSLIRLPGDIPIHYKGKIIDAPFHFRKATSDKHTTISRLDINLNVANPSKQSPKILLHCFGGQPQSRSQPSILPRLPPNYICLSQTIHAPPLFYRIPSDVYVPDIIAAADIVLGKLGWGMCSEVLGNGGKPFIHVPRSAFVEEEGLIRWMKSEYKGLVRIEIGEFEAGKWEDAILEAEKVAEMRGGRAGDGDWKMNEEVLVDIVNGEIDRLLGLQEES